MSPIIRSSSLVFKVIFVTSLILMIAISFSVWLNLRFHEASLKKLTYEKSEIISEFIEKNVIRAMEKGKHFDIHSILKNFASYRGISKITLFRLDGMIRATTHEEELDTNIGDVAFFLKNRHFIQQEAVEGKNGEVQRERIYYLVSPILNRPECFQCHRAEEKIVAVMTVASSLREMDQEISRIKRDSILIAVITIGFLSSVLALLFLKFVNRPIKQLTSTMRRVEEGDLSARVDFKGRDEMGKLAENLNAMIEKLNRARREAEEYHQELIRRANRMASIGELASGIAHEVRNPLAGIQGAVQILADEFPREDARRQVTDEIQKQIHRMERLVKDLLNYAKPVPSHYLPTDINEVAERVLSFFLNQRGRSQDFRIEKNLSTPLPKTLIDPNSMEQAFLNIVLNAQKAMPKGGTLTVSTSRLNGHGERVGEVQIVFEDTGIGIPKDNLPRIFSPFFSTRSDGTGLGLSITKNIVEQYEGRIEVESQVDVGTKFIITLPAMKSA